MASPSTRRGRRRSILKGAREADLTGRIGGVRIENEEVNFDMENNTTTNLLSLAAKKRVSFGRHQVKEFQVPVSFTESPVSSILHDLNQTTIGELDMDVSFGNENVNGELLEMTNYGGSMLERTIEQVNGSAPNFTTVRNCSIGRVGIENEEVNFNNENNTTVAKKRVSLGRHQVKKFQAPASSSLLDLKHTTIEEVDMDVSFGNETINEDLLEFTKYGGIVLENTMDHGNVTAASNVNSTFVSSSSNRMKTRSNRNVTISKAVPMDMSFGNESVCEDLLGITKYGGSMLERTVQQVNGTVSNLITVQHPVASSSTSGESVFPKANYNLRQREVNPKRTINRKFNLKQVKSFGKFCSLKTPKRPIAHAEPTIPEETKEIQFSPIPVLNRKEFQLSGLTSSVKSPENPATLADPVVPEKTKEIPASTSSVKSQKPPAALAKPAVPGETKEIQFSPIPVLNLKEFQPAASTSSVKSPEGPATLAKPAVLGETKEIPASISSVKSPNHPATLAKPAVPGETKEIQFSPIPVLNLKEFQPAASTSSVKSPEGPATLADPVVPEKTKEIPPSTSSVKSPKPPTTLAKPAVLEEAKEIQLNPIPVRNLKEFQPAKFSCVESPKRPIAHAEPTIREKTKEIQFSPIPVRILNEFQPAAPISFVKSPKDPATLAKPAVLEETKEIQFSPIPVLNLKEFQPASTSSVKSPESPATLADTVVPEKTKEIPASISCVELPKSPATLAEPAVPEETKEIQFSPMHVLNLKEFQLAAPTSSVKTPKRPATSAKPAAPKELQMQQFNLSFRLSQYLQEPNRLRGADRFEVLSQIKSELRDMEPGVYIKFMRIHKNAFSPIIIQAIEVSRSRKLSAGGYNKL